MSQRPIAPLFALFARFAPLALTALASCTRVDWVPLEGAVEPYAPPTMTVSGRLCASAPEEVEYPLRVLFVVDGSESMEVSDPPDPSTGLRGRQVAVREAWERLLAQSRASGEVRVGLLRFSAQAQPLTQSDEDGDGVPDSLFTSDPRALEVATDKLSFTDRTTNYLNALDAAYVALRAEALRASGEALGRSRFVVIFISDGLPSDGASGAQGALREQVLSKIADLRRLESLFGVGEVQLHTLFVSTPLGLALDEEAQGLLGAMAEEGGGTYRSAPSGERLSFLHISLASLRRLYSLKALVPLSLHLTQRDAQRPAEVEPGWDAGRFVDADQDGAPSCGEPLADSDGDGLADLFERRVGTDPLLADTDGDLLGDLVEWELRRAGLDPLDPLGAVCDTLDLDTDHDGLTDCEELFLGSSATRVDSDDDGLPDLVEVRLGLSPQQPEGAGDLDWDGTESAVEALSGFDPLCDDAAVRSRVGYARALEEREALEEGRPCYEFTLRGVPLAAPLAPEGEAGAGASARLVLYAGEGSFDERANVSLWRAACVLAPPLGELSAAREGAPRYEVTLSDEDFYPLADLERFTDLKEERCR